MTAPAPATASLSWPPPALESIHGRLWPAIAVLALADIVLVPPLLLSLGTPQPRPVPLAPPAPRRPPRRPGRSRPAHHPDGVGGRAARLRFPLDRGPRLRLARGHRAGHHPRRPDADGRLW